MTREVKCVPDLAMRRRAVTIVIFAFAGVVTNVAVAWGCAVWLDASYGTWQTGGVFIDNPGKYWEVRRIARPGALYVDSIRLWDADPSFIIVPEGPHPATLIPSWGDFDRPTKRIVYFTEYRFVTARGWPLVSLWCEYDDTNPTRWPGVVTAGGGFETPLEWHFHPSLLDGGQYYMHRTLPLRPLWLGFTVDTVFYAVILWLLICGPFALRRIKRRKGGLCPGCGYPIGRSDLCTECGATVTI